MCKKLKKALEGKEYVSKEDADKAVSEAVEKAVAEAKAEMQTSIDKVSAQVKKASQITPQEKTEKSFNDHLADAIQENAESIQSFKKRQP